MSPQPHLFPSECVVEAEGRRVEDGESWQDPSNTCITCTCHVSWGREGEGGGRPYRWITGEPQDTGPANMESLR